MVFKESFTFILYLILNATGIIHKTLYAAYEREIPLLIYNKSSNISLFKDMHTFRLRILRN